MIQYANERVTVFQSALFQTTSTVISLDELLIIVDPNWLPHEIREIQEHVQSIRGNKELYLLFTHGDFDHIIGYRAFPDAKTIGSIGLQNHPKKEYKLHLIHDFDATYYCTRNYPIEFPELDVVVTEDGQQLKLGSSTLHFYLAPGHSADGLFTVVDSIGLFVAGDYLSDFELPFIYDSAKSYKQTIQQSLQIIDDHQIKLLVPGHGLTTDSQPEMKRRALVALDHLERLTQAVLAEDEAAIASIEVEHAFFSPTTQESHKENVRIIRSEYLGK
ncbi:MBL fold metallo-hydrolase [Brevibacillus choshinensis]|uniref:MBL fold metallo-hydrolase n=1 Tax=Brevibacillus choshinensis TaxID=54911 RepID=A0ABX7FLE6_BRECH|nr:MBL fold metallo-hydrolase [Brevibacillus choshinensis]QRG67068.1 MBL fold metallo-hydrolase [Brevibacillus choshinensis]